MKREPERGLATVKQELDVDEEEGDDELQPRAVKFEHPRVKRESGIQEHNEGENHRPRAVKRESPSGVTIKPELNVNSQGVEDGQARLVKREPLLERVRSSRNLTRQAITRHPSSKGRPGR